MRGKSFVDAVVCCFLHWDWVFSGFGLARRGIWRFVWNGIRTLALGLGWGFGDWEGRFIVDRNRTMYEDNFEIN